MSSEEGVVWKLRSSTVRSNVGWLSGLGKEGRAKREGVSMMGEDSEEDMS